MNAQLTRTHVQTQIKINAQILTEVLSAPVMRAGENRPQPKLSYLKYPGSLVIVTIMRMSALALPVGQTLLVKMEIILLPVPVMTDSKKILMMSASISMSALKSHTLAALTPNATIMMVAILVIV